MKHKAKNWGDQDGLKYDLSDATYDFQKIYEETAKFLLEHGYPGAPTNSARASA